MHRCSVDRPEALSARKMRPAQVPQIGLPPLANVRSSGISPQRSAMRAMVVLSPASGLREVSQRDRPSLNGLQRSFDGHNSDQMRVCHSRIRVLLQRTHLPE